MKNRDLNSKENVFKTTLKNTYFNVNVKFEININVIIFDINFSYFRLKCLR